MIYIVQPFDTLFKIAERYGLTVDDLRNANNLTADNDDVLSIGLPLYIPLFRSAQPEVRDRALFSRATSVQYYTVQAGDTLFKIANQFGITLFELQTWNKLTSNNLQIGQKIIVSQAAPTSGSSGSSSSQPTAAIITYTVQAGDTLYKIASQYNTTVDIIKSLNNITGNSLSVGQKVLVPSTSTSSTTTPTPPPTPTTPSSPSTPTETGIYTVQAGDTLFRIANKFGTDVETIKRLNGLTTNNLSVGQKIKVPASAPPSTPAPNPSTATLPDLTAAPLSFSFTMDIADTVGEGGRNNGKDVRAVQDRLMLTGYLAAAHYSQEQADLFSTLADHQLLQTIAAIQRLQTDHRSDRQPSGLLKPADQYVMLLNTFANSASPESLTKINEALSEVIVKTVGGYQLFATPLQGGSVGISGNNLPDDVRRLQQCLTDLGYLRVLHGETPPAQATERINTNALPQTIAALKKFQERIVQYWTRYPEIVGNTKMTTGLVENGDLSFTLLQQYAKYIIEIILPNSTTRKTFEVRNFVRTPFSKYTDGVSYWGTVAPSVMPLQSYINLGLPKVYAKAVQYVSEHEGNFDAINSYDKACFSYGFIQFAGNGGGLAPMLALCKHLKPAVFQRLFQRYGIDVAYYVYNGTIGDAQINLTDPQSGEILRDEMAENRLRQDKRYTGVFVRAAHDTDMQHLQIEAAKRKYVIPAINIELSFNVPVTETLAADKRTPTQTYVGEAATRFKQSNEYTGLQNAQRVRDSVLSFDKTPVTNFIRSEMGLTSLIDITVNQWTSRAADYFVQAILKVAAADRLSTKEKLYRINERKVIAEIAKSSDIRIRDRSSNILNSGLSSEKG